MLNKLTIPKKISVGFQERKGTYTGKLAYVIYTDAKGVLRKEKSWNGWRDQKIPVQEFENVPTAGFVLNKKVGDYRGGWNGRLAWIRVYDPRDFEFEISVANLLFILQESVCNKGKGLEGEFVYSWDGTELVLLPVCSQEYKSSAEFTDLQTKKIGKADMQEGCLYLTKDNLQVMYLGRHDWHQIDDDWNSGNYGSKVIEKTKQHIFVSADGKSTYWVQPGFTKLAAKLSGDPLPSYADEYQKFKESVYATGPSEIAAIPTSWKENDWSNSLCVKVGGSLYRVSTERNYESGMAGPEHKGWVLRRASRPITLLQEVGSPKSYVKVPSPPDGWSSRGGRSDKEVLSGEALLQMKFFLPGLKNAAGSTITLKDLADVDDYDDEDYDD